MNIAFVNSSYRLGGAETVVHDLMTGCAEAGHDTRLYVGFGKKYPRDRRVKPLYPRILSRLHHSRAHDYAERIAPRFDWTSRRLRNLAAGWPDVVHVHNFHGDYASLESLAFVARRKPFVWTLHGHWAFTGGCDHPLTCARFEDACGQCPRVGVWPVGAVDNTVSQLQRKVELLGGIRLNVVTPSRFLAELVARSRAGRGWRVHHIPNGIAVGKYSAHQKQHPTFRRELGLDPTAVAILIVNRNFGDPEKGFNTIREALTAPELLSRPAQVILAGQASESVAAQISPALRPVPFRYIDLRDRLARLYEAADILLFASPAENFPCVILEAMASGCCIVSTPTSGVTEQIEDGQTGMLADGMTGADLGRSVVTAFNDPELRRRLGAAARERVAREFSLERMVGRYLDLYKTAWARSVERVEAEPAHATL